MNKLFCLVTLTLIGLTGCEKDGMPTYNSSSELAIQFRIGTPGQNLCIDQPAFINVTGTDYYRVPTLRAGGKSTSRYHDTPVPFTTQPGLQSSKHTCNEFIYHVVSTYVDAAANNGNGQVKDSIEVGTVDENCLVNITTPGDYYGFRVYAVSKYAPNAVSAFAEVLCAP